MVLAAEGVRSWRASSAKPWQVKIIMIIMMMMMMMMVMVMVMMVMIMATMTTTNYGRLGFKII